MAWRSIIVLRLLLVPWPPKRSSLLSALSVSPWFHPASPFRVRSRVSRALLPLHQCSSVFICGSTLFSSSSAPSALLCCLCVRLCGVSGVECQVSGGRADGVNDYVNDGVALEHRVAACLLCSLCLRPLPLRETLRRGSGRLPRGVRRFRPYRACVVGGAVPRASRLAFGSPLALGYPIAALQA